jgi:hypothetical protein
MRALTQAFQDAISATGGTRYYARLHIYRNRAYVNIADLTMNGPNYAQAAGIHSDAPLPQALEANGNLYTVINNGGSLVFFSNNSAAASVPSVSAMVGTRPALAAGSVFYQGPGGGIYTATVNYGAIDSQQNNCLGSSSQLGSDTFPAAACHALGDGTVVVLYLDDGGIGVRWYQGNGSYVEMPDRLMFPGQVLTATDAPALLNFSAASYCKDGELFVYISAPTGEVLGVRYTQSTWSNAFVAVPADLTRFYLAGSARNATGRVFLFGQFERTEEYNSGRTYTLGLWSDDGFTFCMDRFTLYSLIGYRFLPAFQVREGAHEFFLSDANRHVLLPQTHAYAGTNAQSLIIDAQDLASFSDAGGGELNFSFPDGGENYIRHPLVNEGNICEVQLGINTGTEVEWITYAVTVIAEKSLAVFTRSHKVLLLSEGLWRISELSYPMYLEIQSKQSVYDGAAELDNLYAAPGAKGIAEDFRMDFWVEDNGIENGLGPKANANGSSFTYWTGDLKKRSLTDYPVISAASMPMHIRVFGWSRSGLPDTNPNTSDPTPDNALNDDIHVIFKVKRNLVETEIIIPIARAENGIYWFPETWKATNPRSPTGTTPVVFIVSEADSLLMVDDEVVQVGVRFTAMNGPTYFHLERLEIPEVTMYVQHAEDTSWERVAAEAGSATELPADLELDIFDERHNIYSGSIQVVQHTQSDDFSLVVQEATLVLNNPGKGYWGPNYVIDPGLGSADNTGFADTYGWLHAFVSFKVVTPRSGGNPTGTIRMALAPGDTGGGAYYYLYNDYTPETFTFTNTADATHLFEVTNGYVGGNHLHAEKLWKAASNNEGFFCLGYWAEAGDCTYEARLMRLDWVTSSGRTTFWEVESLDPAEPETGAAGDLLYRAKGAPAVMFSQVPNHTFDFEVQASYQIIGQGSWAGVVGLAEDGKNCVGARVTTDAAQIFKLRDGRETVLASTPGSWDDFEMLLTHRGGSLELRIKSVDTWPDPILAYRWGELDGPMASDPLVMHIGTYTLIDVPAFRICGFYADESTRVGVLGGYSLTALDEFPSSGTVEINGVKYTYTSKTPNAKTARGPFRACNSVPWTGYTNPSSGFSYSGGPALEINYFDWFGVRNFWNTYLTASNGGYTWIVNDTDWRSWITTDGQVQWLRNRARFFGSDNPGNNMVSALDKVWLTSGLNGVVIKDGDAGIHSEGTFCFLDRENSVRLRSFAASSGHLDATVRDMIGMICQMAGARYSFPGDTVYTVMNLSSGNPEVL